MMCEKMGKEKDRRRRLEKLIEKKKENNISVKEYLKEHEVEIEFKKFIEICNSSEADEESENETSNSKNNPGLKLANDFCLLNLMYESEYRDMLIKRHIIDKDNFYFYKYLKEELKEKELYKLRVDDENRISLKVNIFEPFKENGFISQKWHIFIGILAWRDIEYKDDFQKKVKDKEINSGFKWPRRKGKLCFNEKSQSDVKLYNIANKGYIKLFGRKYTSIAMLEWIYNAIDKYCRENITL